MRAFVMIIFALCLELALGRTALAATYFVNEVKSSDANPELVHSLKSLVTSAVSNAGGEVSDNEASADYTLRTDLVKLGQAYVLTVTKIKKNGQTYSSRQKAASVEELDDAADRAVRAAIVASPAKKDLRVGEVKEREENELRRRINSKNFTYFGFGPAGLANLGVSQIAYDFSLGYLWEVTPNAAIKVAGDFVTSADMKTYFLMGELGLHYYLMDTDASPYIGAFLGFGGSASATSSATTIGGLGGSLGLGYLFFRTSSTQFDVFLGYSEIFGNNTIGTPGYYSVKIGVLF